MGTYIVDLIEDSFESTTLRVGFAEPADNNLIVVDAVAAMRMALDALARPGGRLVKITGPASMPVAMALATQVMHKFSAVACHDPKRRQYVVCVSHCAEYTVGQVLPE